MINSLLLALALQALPPGVVEIRGRSYGDLAQATQTFSSLCDGRPVAVNIRKDARGQRGKLELIAGRLGGQVSRNLLDERLFSSPFLRAGLACDGVSVGFRIRIVEASPDGALVVDDQSVTLDLRSGDLSVSPTRRLPPEEAKFVLSPVGR